MAVIDLGKDPAFLFYSSDFLTGVSDLTMEERGQYITLLCLQHQKGHLSEKTIRLCLGLVSVSEIKDVMKKFRLDEDGNYYNIRLEKEINLRLNFIESRKINGSKGGRPKKEEKPNENLVLTTSEASEKLIEDENEDVNISKKNLDSFFESIWKLYPKKQGKGSVSKTQKEVLFKIGFEEISRCIDRYKKYIRAQKTEEQFIQYGSTFFNSGYIDYLDKNFSQEQKPILEISNNPEDWSGF